MENNIIFKYQNQTEQTNKFYLTLYTAIATAFGAFIFKIGFSSPFTGHTAMIIGFLLGMIGLAWHIKLKTWVRFLNSDLNYIKINKPEDYKYYQFIFDDLDKVKIDKKNGSKISLDFPDRIISFILALTGFGLLLLGVAITLYFNLKVLF